MAVDVKHPACLNVCLCVGLCVSIYFCLSVYVSVSVSVSPANLNSHLPRSTGLLCFSACLGLHKTARSRQTNSFTTSMQICIIVRLVYSVAQLIRGSTIDWRFEFAHNVEKSVGLLGKYNILFPLGPFHRFHRLIAYLSVCLSDYLFIFLLICLSVWKVHVWSPIPPIFVWRNVFILPSFACLVFCHPAWLPVYPSNCLPDYLFTLMSVCPPVCLTMCPLKAQITAVAYIEKRFHFPTVCVLVVLSVCLTIYMYLFILLYGCLTICVSFCLSVCLTICLSFSLSDYLFILLPVCLIICLLLSLSAWLSVYPSVCLPDYMFVFVAACLSDRLSVYLLDCVSPQSTNNISGR